MSWMSDKTGRPKEQGGHKPLKISVDKFVAQGLEKVGNKSQFLESVARPVLEQLDPGEASPFFWQVESYLSQQITVAAQNKNFKQVQALSWVLDQLEDVRKLCGPPPSNYNAPAVSNSMPRESELDKELTDREVAIRYFQWRGTPEGGDNRFFRNMFGEPRQKSRQGS